MLETQFLRLLETKGFIECFWEMLSNYATQEESYEAVESIYRSIFGKNKYQNFDSFRVTMHTYLKVQRCKKQK